LSPICTLSLVLSFIRLTHDARPQYECGFESGRLIGYGEIQRKKKLNLTAIFKSTIFSFFLPFVVRCLDLDTQTTALQVSIYLCALFYDKSLYCSLNVTHKMPYKKYEGKTSDVLIAFIGYVNELNKLQPFKVSVQIFHHQFQCTFQPSWQ